MKFIKKNDYREDATAMKFGCAMQIMITWICFYGGTFDLNGCAIAFGLGLCAFLYDRVV